MIYLCHLLVFILPGGCCQHQGLLFTMWQLHLKREDSPCKNSASKQIRPEPLKRSGGVQDPFPLHVNQNDATARTNLHYFCAYAFCLESPCMGTEWGLNTNAFPDAFCLDCKADPENYAQRLFLKLIICSFLFFLSAGFKLLHIPSFFRLPSPCLLPNLQATGRLLYIK